MTDVAVRFNASVVSAAPSGPRFRGLFPGQLLRYRQRHLVRQERDQLVVIGCADVVALQPGAEAFGQLVPKLKELGDIAAESTKAEDVSDQYVDVSARLASAKTLEKRLLELAD